MVQQPVELILLKQVAGYLATPMFLVDPDGNLLYYNEPAEELLGHRYEETGQMPLEEWGTIFSPTDSLGRPLPAEDLPLAQALLTRSEGLLPEGHPDLVSVLTLKALLGRNPERSRINDELRRAIGFTRSTPLFGSQAETK